MIRDCSFVTDQIIRWLRGQAASAGAKTGVVGVSGGIDSAVVAALLVRAFPEALGVIMPCRSSASSTERGLEVCKALGIQHIVVDLDRAHDLIRSQIVTGLSNLIQSQVVPSRTDDGALRSCLRAPVLDYAAKLVDGIIVGTGNRDEDGLVRYFQKRGDGAVDVSPIADLHKSEVYQLAYFLELPKSVLDAVPSADLWGPDVVQIDEDELGISYSEIEWADQEDRLRGILTGRNEHTSVLELATCYGYTSRDLGVIDRVRYLERSSRHKASPPPVFELRTLEPDVFDSSAPAWRASLIGSRDTH